MLIVTKPGRMVVLQSSGLVKSRDKLNMLYLYLTNGQQIWPYGRGFYLYIKSTILQCIWSPNVSEWWYTALFIYLFIYLIHYLNSITRSYETNLYQASIKNDILK